MSLLLRIALSTVILLSAAGSCLATYLLGYSQGQRDSAASASMPDPQPAAGANKSRDVLRQVTKSAPPFDAR